METRDLGGLIRERQVLVVCHINGSGPDEATLTGQALGEWARALASLAGEMEACPGCGCREPAEQLLEEGCPYCHWVSPWLTKGELEARSMPSE